jgi:Subtilisin inhibitor-like
MTDGGEIMMRAMTAVLTAAMVLGAAGPAAAMGPGPATRSAAKPRSALVLSYMADAGYAAAVTLTCDPAGGAHPKPAKACATLTKAGGRPGRLKPSPAICTLEYAPITAAVEGTWKGRTVRWSKTFPNTCDLTRATGMLFAF